MKYKPMFLFSALAVMLILTAFVAGKASASTGCFIDTNGHWAETFICWMKDNGITTGTGGGNYSPNNYVTRAEMAVFMQKVSTFGDTYINAGLTAWQPNIINPTAHIEYSGSQTLLKPLAVGTYHYQANLPIMSSLHSQQMTIKGVELCYNSTQATIDSVGVYLTAPNGFFGVIDFVSDDTNRTDTACRTYSFTTPDLLNAHENLNIIVKVISASINDYVAINSLTAIQGTTPNAATLGTISPSESVLDLQAPPPGILHNP